VQCCCTAQVAAMWRRAGAWGDLWVDKGLVRLAGCSLMHYMVQPMITREPFSSNCQGACVHFLEEQCWLWH
jgi:hypothetical protein